MNRFSSLFLCWDSSWETAGVRQATDPRDLIYSVLGFVETCFYKDGRVFVPSALVIDYEAPLEVVYSSFIKEVVTCTNRLDVLAFCYGTHRKQSWSPDWSNLSLVTAGSLAQYITTANYNFLEALPFNATPGTFSDAEFDDDLSTLTVSRFIWDTITIKLVRIHDDEDFYQELGRLCRLLLDEPRDESDTTIEAMRDQLMEVFTMNPRNSQEYLSAFQDFVGTADENGSSSAT